MNFRTPYLLDDLRNRFGVALMPFDASEVVLVEIDRRTAAPIYNHARPAFFPRYTVKLAKRLLKVLW